MRFGQRIWRRGAAAALGLSLTIVAFAASTPTVAEDQKKPVWQNSVDYWHPQWMQRELWGPGYMPQGMRVRVLRHWTFVHYGVPKDYQGARPTEKTSAALTKAGGQLYGLHCASCHGPRGMGGGDGARSVAPSPALLAYMIQRPISVDEYLLWAIADGGEQFQTQMPTFKNKLSRDEIWKIIAFMRAGFPEVIKISE